MNKKIAVVGLGYVGLPVAVAFGKKHRVIGFDVNEEKIKELEKGIDITGEVSRDELSRANILYTSDEKDLKNTDFIIVAVPTPIDEGKQPDLKYLDKASETVGNNIKKGTIVVFESTVYPGVTEDFCVPIIEKNLGLKKGEGFFVGYSPERINPGDKKHTFENIVKVVAGEDEKTTDVISEVYSSVVKAGTYKAPSIKVAEAAKVIENTQRDLNIALMNELAVIFDRMDIDTREVLETASTKWNFLPFTPGLVGGHCIGVDPYYLTYKAEKTGYYPQMILAGRRINDGMGEYIAKALVKEMIKKDILVQGSTVTILGFTFKENVPDIRNTKVVDIINELEDYGVNVQVHDSVASKKEIKINNGINLLEYDELKPSDGVILAVPHDEYVNKGWNIVLPLLKNKQGVVIDIKSVLDKEKCPENVKHWRL